MITSSLGVYALLHWAVSQANEVEINQVVALIKRRRKKEGTEHS